MSVLEASTGRFVFVPAHSWREVLNGHLDVMCAIAASSATIHKARFGAYGNLGAHLECTAEILGVAWCDKDPIGALALMKRWIDAMCYRRHDLVPFMHDEHGIPRHTQHINGDNVHIWYVARPALEALGPQYALADPDPNDPYTVSELMYVTGVSYMFYNAIKWGSCLLKQGGLTRHDRAMLQLVSRSIATMRRHDPRFEVVKTRTVDALPDKE